MNLDASTVTAILKRTPFNPKRLRFWGVRVDGQVWPVKDAYAAVTKQSMASFNTREAREAFRKLGMKVLHVSHVTSTRAGCRRSTFMHKRTRGLALR